MTITANLQDLLMLIQIHAKLIALIQTRQTLLAQCGYTRTNNVSASTNIVNMATVTPSAYHTSPTQPGYGPNQFVSTPAQQPISYQICNSVGQPGSNPVGHETLMPNAFSSVTLQDLTTGNWNMDTVLFYVCQFVRDNNCGVEFDAFGFSVKDLMTCRVLLRCDSTGDLYPVTKPSTISHAFLTS
ncbi:hypothetical protein Tco_1350667 [Tanacetum coccineum]